MTDTDAGVEEGDGVTQAEVFEVFGKNMARPSGQGHVADWPLTSDLVPLGALPTAPRLARGFIGVVLNGWVSTR